VNNYIILRGTRNDINAANSLAFGTIITISGSQSFSIGNSDTVSGDNSCAIGNNSVAAEAVYDIFKEYYQ
jgi:autotransporter adhesin